MKNPRTSRSNDRSIQRHANRSHRMPYHGYTSHRNMVFDRIHGPIGTHERRIEFDSDGIRSKRGKYDWRRCQDMEDRIVATERCEIQRDWNIILILEYDG